MSSARIVPKIAAVLTVLVAAPGALAANLSEAVTGDLSGDRLAPTFLQLDALAAGNTPGSNIVDGTVGRNPATGEIDRDYLWVNVPEGHVLAELRVGNQTQVGGNGAFIGFANGVFMPVDPAASTAAGLLGWKLYTLADRNTDILDDLALAGNGASGFGGTLGPGDYTFWVQELATGSFAYRFNFVVAPVPVPAAAWLLGSGLAALALRRRRRGAAVGRETREA